MPDRRQAVYTAIILSLLTGLFTGRAFFFNLAYMFIGLLVVTVLWSWMAVRWIGIQRRTRSSRAQVGQSLEEVFTVRNLSFLPKLWLEVIDHSTLAGHHASHVIPAMGPRSLHGWKTKTRCLARGEFQLGPMTLTSGDPFGLFLLQRHIAAKSRIIVYPTIVPISQVNLPVGMLSGGEAQRRRTHYITTNAAGVRDYVPGDSFNRIHWKSTARKGHLIVKEFEIDPLVDIWLFTDFSQKAAVEDPEIQRINGVGPIITAEHRHHIPKSTEEYIAVAAASLARYFLGLDRAVGFAAYTPSREIHQPERGSRQEMRILESLAVARSLSTYTLAQMISLETPYFTRGTTCVIVTACLDSRWVREAQILYRRGIRPVCIFIDPTSFGSAEVSDTILGTLQLAKIPTLVIKYGDDMAKSLMQRPNGADSRNLSV